MAAVYKVGKKWRADWIDAKGVRHRRRFKTKGDADDFLVKIGPELKDGTWVSPKNIPAFGVIADAWLRGRIEISRTPGAGYRPSTLQQWQSHVAHLKFSFEHRRADTITAQAFAEAMAQWRLPKPQGRGLSPKTCGKVKTTASRVFRYAMANKLGIREDTTKLMEPEKLSSGEQLAPTQESTNLPIPLSRAKLLHQVTEKEVLTLKESKALLLAIDPGVYRNVIVAALDTGARISELLALHWADVDLDKAQVTIRRTMSTARVKGLTDRAERWGWYDPKTAAGARTIPMPPRLVTTLKEWREKCPESRFGLVFCNAFGEPLDRTAIGREVLAPALQRAGIEKKITPHCLRHTYASILFSVLGRDEVQVSKYLGHSNTTVTRAIYLHFIETHKDVMADYDRAVKLS